MGNLRIEKLLAEPVAPFQPSTMYVIRENTLPPPSIGWRIVASEIGSNGANWWITIGELDFVGTGNTGTHFGTSHQSTYSPDKAFDGSLSTIYVSSLNAAGARIGMVFGSPVVVPEVVVSAGNVNVPYTPNGFIIQYSNDTTDGTDGTWIDAKTVSGLGGWTSEQTRSFPLDVPADSFKVWVSSSDGSTVAKSLDKESVARTIANADEGLTVADIATRDALTLQTNIFVVVEDASGDPSIGEAIEVMYFWIHAESRFVRLTAGSQASVATTEW